jgi:crotonobetainyl-CoA:carnitine CoA-transferase CaiB-like acyl-CoA transferase
MDHQMQNFFSDLKIIELAGVLAGPSAGAFFAELGAKVIKIENPKTKGDVTRTWKLPSEDKNDPASAYYWSVNSGKQVLFLDLKKEPDLKQLYELIKDADVVIANYKKGDDEKLKVDQASLKKINPTLIYASLNGFGENSERTAFDLILQAEAGFMLINGEANSSPVKMPVALIDLLAGHQLKEAILIALLKREREKKGSYITVSLFESAVTSLANQATNWLVAGQLPEAMGSLHPNIAPYGELFLTKDRHLITFAIGSDSQFQKLCRLLAVNLVGSESKYSSNQERLKNREELYNILKTNVERFNFEELYRVCLENDLPIAKLRNMKEVFELPEAKAMLNTVEGKQIVKNIAFKFLDDV